MAVGNAINESTTGICGFTGTGFTGTPATQYAVIIGGSTSSTLSNVGPTATAGQVLQSAGNAANPAFSTATYPLTTTVSQILYSSATNTVTGLATANSGVLTTSSSGVPSIDTTNFAVLSTGVQMKGNNTNTAPPAGFIGEQIRATGTITPASNTNANICSISLTAGIWDVSGVQSTSSSGGSQSVQNLYISVNSASFTGAVEGDNYLISSVTVGAGQWSALSIPSFRVTLSGTTTYYLVTNVVYTGTTSIKGRISATRVG